MELEQALARIKDLEAQIADKDVKLGEVTSDMATVQTEVAGLKTANAELITKVDTFELKSKVEARTKKVTDAGIAVPTDEQELTTKQEAWAAMSEELFTMYVSDLAAVAKSIPERKGASASVLQLPKISLDTSRNNGAVTSEDLRNKMHSLGRNEVTAE